MKRFSVLLFTCLFVTAGSEAQASPANLANKAVVVSNSIPLAADEVKKMIDDRADIIIIDSRTEVSFKAGHLPGAINLPADKVNSETLAAITDDMGRKLLFYSDSLESPESNIAAQMAIGAGYRYVYKYTGGLSDWKQHGYEVIANGDNAKAAEKPKS